MKITGSFETREVWVNGKPLDPGPSLRVWCHSPSGFNWGYEGSGPAQLALAILLLVTNNDIAARLHQDFKREVIARDRKSTRLNSSHQIISYAVFCLKK